MLNALKDLDLDKITEAVKCAVSLGISLQTMVGGYVIEVHLRVITMALPSQSEFGRDRPMHNIDLQVRAIAPHGKYESIFKKIVFTIYSCAKISPIILPRYM